MTNINLNSYTDPINIQQQLAKNHYKQLQQKQQYVQQTKILLDWLQSDSKKPFILYGYRGVGKTYFLSHLQKICQQNFSNQKFLFRLMDCRLGVFYKNFSHQIYNLLSVVRRILSINNVIQIEQQRIRKYFYYWIFKIEQNLKSQIINNNQKRFKKVVLVIEGIENLIRKSIYEELKFFLPTQFSQNFKVIVLIDRNKQSYIPALRYFKQMNYPRLQITIQNQQKILIMIQEKANKKVRYMISNYLKDTHFFLLKKMAERFELTASFINLYISYLIPSQDERFAVEQISELDYIYENISYDVIQQINNEIELIQYILKYMQGNFKKQVYWKYFYYLFLSYKGLEIQSLKNLTKSTLYDVKLFYSIFRYQILRFGQNSYLFLNNQNLRNQIQSKIQTLPKQQFLAYHMVIYQQIYKYPYSINKLEEMLYHLYMSQNHFKLKQQIIKVQNFIIIFKSQSKFLLFKFWKTLIEKGYDPVIDYNKSLEYFIMEYLPTPQSLFDILFMFACFFRQMHQFQNFNTPPFRHHKIIGSLKQFKQLGIYQEMLKLNLVEIRQKKSKNQQHFLLRNTPNQNISKKILQLHQLKSQKKIIKQKLVKTILRKNQQSLNLHQKLNPNIPQNVSVFKKHFQQIIDSFKDSKTQINNYFYDQSIDQQQKNKQQIQQIPTFQYIKTQQQFRKSEPKYYYYKRWLWTKFPLITLSIWKDFNRSLSLIINPQSQSLSQQNIIYQNSVRLVISIKQHRKNIMSKFQITDQMIKNKIKRTNSRSNFNLSFQQFGSTTTLSLRHFTINQQSQSNIKTSMRNRVQTNSFKKISQYLGRTKLRKNEIQSKYTTIQKQQLGKTQEHNQYFGGTQYNSISIKTNYNKLNYEYKKLKKKLEYLKNFRQKNQNHIQRKITEIKQHKNQPQKINLLRNKQRQYFIKLIEKSRFDLVKSLCQQNNPISKEHLQAYIQYSHNLKHFLEIQKQNHNKLKINIREISNLKRQYSDIISTKQTRMAKRLSNFTKTPMNLQKKQMIAQNETESIYQQVQQFQEQLLNENWIRLDKVQHLIKYIQKQKILKQKIIELKKIQGKLVDEPQQENIINRLNHNQWQLTQPITQQIQNNSKILQKIKTIIDLYQLQ